MHTQLRVTLWFVCYPNCSDLLWEKRNVLFSDQEKLLKFEAEGQEFAKFLSSLEQFIQTVKGQNNCSWRFLICNKFRTIKIQIGKDHQDFETCMLENVNFIDRKNSILGWIVSTWNWDWDWSLCMWVQKGGQKGT